MWSSDVQNSRTLGDDTVWKVDREEDNVRVNVKLRCAA
jgi:hypothetical protein